MTYAAPLPCLSGRTGSPMASRSLTAIRRPPLGILRAFKCPLLIQRRTVQWLTSISCAACSTLTYDGGIPPTVRELRSIFERDKAGSRHQKLMPAHSRQAHPRRASGSCQRVSALACGVPWDHGHARIHGLPGLCRLSVTSSTETVERPSACPAGNHGTYMAQRRAARHLQARYQQEYPTGELRQLHVVTIRH